MMPIFQLIIAWQALFLIATLLQTLLNLLAIELGLLEL
jgi:hypothetical protein